MTSIEEGIADEQAAWSAVTRHAEALAEAAATHTIWGWGDGYGGAVQSVIQDAFARHGLHGPPKPVRVPLPDALRAEVLEADNFRCRWCNSTDRPTVDHIIPVAWGGTNARSNLQTLCQPHNSAKGDRLRVDPSS